MATNRHVPKLDVFAPASIDEIEKCIINLKNKCCSLDIMPTWLFKDNVTAMAPILQVIINKSLTSSVVPQIFKIAIVKPTIKKFNLDPEDFYNYRPVSNLSVFSKLMERVVFARLEAHLSDNKLLSPSQSAYRKNHSTETLLLGLTNDILTSFDKGYGTILVTLDVSAAFDTVNHENLLERYEKYFGIEGSALNWMASYLKNRKQSVEVGTSRSRSMILKNGFPQGSILGGPKFNMHTAPISEITRHHVVRDKSYADDTNLYVAFKINDHNDFNSAVEKLENCLSDIQYWMLQNRLKVNCDKTEVVIFIPSKKASFLPLQNLQFNIAGDIIKPQTQIKCLGVTLDSAMKMTPHINKVVSSAWLQIRRISKIRSQISNKVAQTLVNALVTSKFDYCNSLLSKLPANATSKLQRAQNAAAKLITKSKKFEHVTPLLKELHWLPIKYRSFFKVLLFTYKAIKNESADYINELIECKWQLRNARVLLRTIDNAKSRFGDRSFLYCAPSLWNSLPSRVTETTSLVTFKKELKTFYFTQAYI